MSAKKNVITIRNFRGLPTLSPESIEQKWLKLESEIVAIFNSSNCTNSLKELYRIAEELYTARYSPVIKNLQVLFESYLNQKLEIIIENVSDLLFVISDFWKEFCQHVITMKNIFLSYDRSLKYFKYNTVQSISWGLFTKIIILNPVVKKTLIEEILQKITEERQGLDIDRVLLKSVIDMLNSLQVYENIFLGDFLKLSEDFYKKKGSEIIKKLDVPQYLLFVIKTINQEEDRIVNYLNKSTENQILRIIYTQLIEKHITEILDKGFDELIEKNMFYELILIYIFFQKIVNGLKYLNSYFKNFIIKKGTSITDPKNEKNLIQDLLDFKDSLDEIIKISFDNKREFHECVRSSFKNFINNSHSKSAQLLAKYLDVKLRSKDINDLEEILTKVLTLFRHIQGKDIFEVFYKKLLAKRLLLDKSVNENAENSMISKLRKECGSGFTSNIEGMFQDIDLSKSINTLFRTEANSEDNPFNSEFFVNVLTRSYWPNFPNFIINLPFELVTYQQKFQKFYLSNHSNRNLFWQPCLSYCLVKATFNFGRKELQVSLFQTVILLLFNTRTKLTFKEIQKFTNLENLELKRTLLSLVFGKAKVLLKTPKSKEVGDDDVFCVNLQFTDKLYRVKINQIQLQESPEEEKETEKNVLVDRQFQIDAAIVRIMKNKKIIKHDMLVRELDKVLEISVDQVDLKKRIESLIQQEYMKRDKENKSTYIYIA